MKSLDSAFASIDRADFMLEQYRHLSGLDRAFPIGFGQTISWPTVVRLMLQWLEARPGQKVLDVGSGSGWTSALLGRLVRPRGQVVAVERVPELVELGRANCARAGVENVAFHRAKWDQLGWPDEAPYDRILVSAAADELPRELIDQLAPGGKMVVPVRNDILVVEKAKQGEGFKTTTHPGFVFVPLVS